MKAGLFRPLTVWPFPVKLLEDPLARAQRLVVVEASSGGQLEDELRLSLSKAGLMPPPIQSVRRSGGILPQQEEIVDGVIGGAGVKRRREVSA